MSRVIIFIAILGCGLAIPEISKAQKAGIGLVYGDKLNMVGGQLDATYRFHKYFRIGGNVAAFLPQDFEDSNNQWSWWSINVNGNLVFLDTGRFRSYLLTGLNYATIKVQYPQTGATSVDSGLGLNAGGGVEYSLTHGDLFGEAKHIFIGERYQQIAVNIGIRFFLQSR